MLHGLGIRGQRAVSGPTNGGASTVGLDDLVKKEKHTVVISKVRLTLAKVLQLVTLMVVTT